MPGVNDWRSWIAKATSDVKSVRKLMRDDDETLDTASYHCQQVGEKALKAYLVFKKQSVPKTHDLVRLLEDCLELDISFQKLREDAEILVPFVTYSRYPDDRFEIDREEVEDILKRSERMLQFVKAKIEPVEENTSMSIFQEGQ